MGVLWELGTDGVQVELESFDEVRLLAWFEREPASLTARILAVAPTAAVELTEVPEVDWVARFKEGFRSFTVGSFAIVPAWEAAGAADERTLLVDPGQAFGTGTHESTRLSITGLEILARDRPLGRVVDVGAGTGILAIAAARLGARFVVATDLDGDAVEEAVRHRRLNAAPVHVARGDGARPFRARGFDVVVANLTGPLLRARSDELAALLAPRGRMVLAGFLVDEIEAIRDAFPVDLEIRRDGEWAGALLR